MTRKPKKAKSVKSPSFRMWAVVKPLELDWVWAIAPSKKESVVDFIEGSAGDWPFWKRLGFRSRRVTITVEPKP